ncbi:MAG: PadR family transcriptional regulator [Syntrophomonadaceae bacterium]|mgnify:CR=1 FL=1|nr:PadR family transcriptional regulator [Syntrophomonadaceae bacterium]
MSSISVKYTILGLLMERPYYGYQLKSEAFKKVFGDFGINDGQLYPTLNKLEQEGLLTKTVEIQLGAPNRHIYTITEKGRDEFMRWLTAGDAKQNTVRYDFLRKDPFLIRCNYLRYIKRTDTLKLINEEINAVQAAINDFSRARDAMIKKKIDPVRISILEYGIRIKETRLEWLRNLTKLIEKES